MSVGAAVNGGAVGAAGNGVKVMGTVPIGMGVAVALRPHAALKSNTANSVNTNKVRVTLVFIQAPLGAGLACPERRSQPSARFPLGTNEGSSVRGRPSSRTNI